MRTFIISATTVKALIIGLETYRTMLLRTAEGFLAGYSVGREVKDAVAQELTLVDEWLKRLRFGHEYPYTTLSEDERVFLRHIANYVHEGLRLAGERLASRWEGVEFKQIDELVKRLEEELEGPHLGVKKG